MKKVLAAILVTFFATPVLACDCHGGASSSGMYRGFGNWALPSVGCTPTHDLSSTSQQALEEEAVSDSPESVSKPTQENPKTDSKTAS